MSATVRHFADPFAHLRVVEPPQDALVTAINQMHRHRSDITGLVDAMTDARELDRVQRYLRDLEGDLLALSATVAAKAERAHAGGR